MIERLLRAWCKSMHTRLSRPINREYVCLECLRRYPVPWGPEPDLSGVIDLGALRLSERGAK